MRRTLALVGGVGLGLALGQFPEYAQQYTQRLGGAVDELRVITTEFDSAATAAGLTRDEAIARYGLTGDTFVEGRGRSMAGTFARFDTLSATLTRISGADPVERFRLLPSYLDSDIGVRTLAAFKPAMPLTVEGFAYGAAGFAIGYVVLSALIRLLLLPFSRWTRRRVA